MKQSVKKWIIVGIDIVYLLAVLILCFVEDEGEGGFLYFPPLTVALLVYAFSGGIPLGFSAFLWWTMNSKTCGRWVKINGILGVCGGVLNLLLLLLQIDADTAVLSAFCKVILSALVVSWIAMGIVGIVQKCRSRTARETDTAEQKTE